MDPVVALIIGLAVGLVLGVLVGWLISRTRGRGATDTNALSTLQSQAAGAAATAAALRDQVDQLLQQQKLNQAKSDEDNRILQVLTPVQEALRTMQTQVGELERERTTQFGAISQQLLSARQSEEQLRATAESLASALRSNSVRGVWGETQLRRVVEAAGLIDHVDFIEQASVQSDVGRGRIDMVVQLSDRKSLAVDSKVPFDSYLLAQQIPLTATEPPDAGW